MPLCTHSKCFSYYCVSLNFFSPTGGLDRSVDTPIPEGEEPTDDGILDRLQVKTLSINVAKKAQKARENEGKQPQITN